MRVAGELTTSRASWPWLVDVERGVILPIPLLADAVPVRSNPPRGSVSYIDVDDWSVRIAIACNPSEHGEEGSSDRVRDPERSRPSAAGGRMIDETHQLRPGALIRIVGAVDRDHPGAGETLPLTAFHRAMLDDPFIHDDPEDGRTWIAICSEDDLEGATLVVLRPLTA
jgi:hypothetical protein